MKILVLNAGSSSLKYRLLEMPSESVLASGLVERVGETQGLARYTHRLGERPAQSGLAACAGHGQALELVLAELVHPQRGCLGGLDEIGALGHRVVHGGDIFRAPAVLDQGALESLRGLVELAPLHMPPAIACIEACLALMGDRKQVAHFDTTFHQSMPEHAYLYPLPLEWHEKYGLRRYGFHGSSHEYATLAAARWLGRPPEDLRLLTAHLGNGASVTAWDRGRVLDTSMGFTPLEGIMMGTRPGWIDAALVPFLACKMGCSAQEVVDRLNLEGGLLGVSGLSRDLRAITEARARGHERCDLAWRMFVFRLLKCLGGYLFALGGAEAVVLTGGIGENAWEMREALFAGTAALGLVLDPERNRQMVNGQEGFISTSASPVKLLVIGAQEELMIARATQKALGLVAPEEA